MLNRSQPFQYQRHGSASPVVVALLAGILLAFIVLIIVLLTGRNPTPPTHGPSGNRAPEPPAVSPGQKVSREELPNPPKKPKAIGDEKRIRDVLQVGRNYELLMKGGFTARVEDKDWGVNEVTNLAFYYEMPATRSIESNDGKTVVELRQFGKIAVTKLLTVESVTIDLGVPGDCALGVMEWFEPGSGITVLSVKPVAEAILGAAARSVASDNAKAFGQVDSLSGKKVRITYVDGVGVQSIEPISCSLTASERDYVFNLALLSDSNMMRLDIPPGGTWTIAGSEFIGLLDPTMRGVPRGEVAVVREADQEENGKKYGMLRIQPNSYLEIDSSDASTRRIGSLAPQGTLRYNITDGYVDNVSLTGDVHLEKVSQDHLLFEASYKTRPELKGSYSCKMR